MPWLDTFLASRAAGVAGADLLDVVGDAASQPLDDPCLLHDVIRR